MIASTTRPSFLFVVIAMFVTGLTTSSEAFCLQMAAMSTPPSKTSSRTPKPFLPIVKTKKTSFITRLNYANDATRTTSRSNRRQNSGRPRLDPVKAIAFLNDPERKYKKRSRPRYLSAFDRERRAISKAAVKAQAQANFEFGQRAAQRAIKSVLKEHGIEDTCTAPWTEASVRRLCFATPSEPWATTTRTKSPMFQYCGLGP